MTLQQTERELSQSDVRQGLRDMAGRAAKAPPAPGLDRHLSSAGTPPRIAVWAHNSHLGDAAATDMGERGEWNVGQLVRERYATQAVRVGCSTPHGWVTAASNWDEPAQRKRVRAGLPGSWEDVFHKSGTPQFLLPLRDDAALRAIVAAPGCSAPSA